MMNLLTVQGRYAATFRFRHQTGGSFASNLRGVVSGATSVISTTHRTDVIFNCEEADFEQLQVMWAYHIGLPLHLFDKNHLVKMEGAKDVLEYYFASLVMLNRVKMWYDEYVEEFRKVYMLDHQNPLLREIVNCDQYLHMMKQDFRRECLVPEDGEMCGLFRQEFSIMAKDAAEHLSLN